MKTADNAGLCQVIEAIGLPAVLEQCAEELAGPIDPGTRKTRVRGAAPCNMTAK